MVRTPQLATLYAAFVAVLWIALPACSAPAAMTPVESPVIATLIVKPRITTSEPAAVLTPMRAALGQAAGVRYVRPMAGDAHLVHLTEPAQRSEVPRLVEQLRASGAFQYVEIDSMMKTQ
jgi:hypothetical protein